LPRSLEDKMFSETNNTRDDLQEALKSLKKIIFPELTLNQSYGV